MNDAFYIGFFIGLGVMGYREHLEITKTQEKLSQMNREFEIYKKSHHIRMNDLKKIFVDYE
jgi:hypothetical protein